MAHSVIIGAGLGGMPAAHEMRALLPEEHRITVVNPVDYFQFTPSNPWVAVGWRERPVVTLDYDYLVITTGPKLGFDEVAGAGPNGGFTHSVCTVGHAEQFCAEYREFLKNPGPVVIGAMPGASCFGPACEFAFIPDTDLRRRKLRNKVPVTFVTSEPSIGHLGLGGAGDGKSMLESEMRGHDIQWVTDAKTTKVEAGELFTTELDDHGKPYKEHELAYSEPVHEKYVLKAPGIERLVAR